MKRRRDSIWLIFVVVFILFLCFACSGKSDGTEKGEASAAEVTETERQAVAEPAVNEGIVSFCSGDVIALRNDEEREIEIGDPVRREDTIKVGSESWCEIQFPGCAVVRLQEETILEIGAIDLSSGGRTVQLEMTAGSVLCKVQKLIQEESFAVKTPAVVCGVRGTEFTIKAAGQDKTVVAVKSGAVAVLPATLAVSELTGQTPAAGGAAPAAGAAQMNASLAEMLGMVEREQAIIVEANEEIAITEEIITQTAKISEDIQRLVTETARTGTVRPEKLAQLRTSLETNIAAAVKKIEPPAAASAESVSGFRPMDRMELLEFAPVQAPAEPGAAQVQQTGAQQAADQTAQPPAPLPALIGITIVAEPADSRILVNGEEGGIGRVSSLFRQGETIDVTVEREGYRPHSMHLETADTTGAVYTVRLRKAAAESASTGAGSTAGAASAQEPKKIEICFTIQPADGKITLNGEAVGSGTVTRSFTGGERITVGGEREGYDPYSEILNVTEGTPARYEISLKEKPVQPVSPAASPTAQASPAAPAAQPGPAREPARLVVSVTPSDAAISVNGRAAGKGTFTGDYTEGDNVTISASRGGFAAGSRTVTLAKGENRITMELEAKPIEVSASVSKASFIGTFSVGSGLIYCADRSGTVYALSPEGKVLWTAQTGNSPNENSYPVISGDSVLFSGARELVKLNGKTGAVEMRRDLAADESHMFGRRCVPAPTGILFPSDSRLQTLETGSGQIRTSRVILDGTQMSPAVWKDKAVIANQTGTFFIIDLKTGVAITSLKTSAVQPVAHAPGILNDRAVFVGRKGMVICIDLIQERILWQRKITEGLTVFTDPLAAEQGIYILAKNTMFALNWADGTDLFKPVEDVAAPPAVISGTLVYPALNGSLVFADPGTGKRTKVCALPDGAVGVTRPAAVGKNIAIGTRTGTFLLVNPDGVR